jgi:hypothetical protein
LGILFCVLIDCVIVGSVTGDSGNDREDKIKSYLNYSKTTCKWFVYEQLPKRRHAT